MKRLTAVTLVLAAGTILRAQPALTNDDLIKLTKSGLSEEFILNLIQQQPSKLYTETPRLAELKSNGVSERIIAAAVKKTPPQEPLTSDGVIRLVKSGFSETFILDLIEKGNGKFSTDAAHLIDLKQAGVSERVLSAMVGRSAREIARGTDIVIRMIDSVDSEKDSEGAEFRASLEEPVTFSGQTLAARGADARVQLVSEKDSGKLSGKTELRLQLVAVSIGGRMVPVTTSVYEQTSGSRGSRTAKSAAAVGVIGAIIGGIAGGGKGAAAGAAAGAGAGAGAQVFMKGQRVKIPSETVLTFTLESTVKID